MPHLYRKTFKGRTYWYLREVHRVGRKVRGKWQKYLGTPETILAGMEEARGLGKPIRLNTGMFGVLFVAYIVEKVLDTTNYFPIWPPRPDRSLLLVAATKVANTTCGT